ncbi:MAG: oligopeptide ABC transporter ATP-binding protein OppD, partial [bacterium]|nr:oligopeptide ABC transporter ATP-binding protein OppD [bacterium]
VVVMYGGYVVESGTLEQVYRSPSHPYTQALINAVPNLDVPEPGFRRPSIPGPPLGTTPYVGGCPFAPRCVMARDACLTLDMLLQPVDDGHLTACPFTAEGSEPLVSRTIMKGDAP